MQSKFKVVLSDLHMGAGFYAEGNALEDFTCDAELVGLLGQLAVESRSSDSEVEVIFAGDAFEVVQVPHVDSFNPAARYRPEDFYSTTEADSARKVALIIDGHRQVFNALRDFLALGPPRRSVTFVKGNHDLELYWPAVQNLIRDATATTGARFPLLRFEARFLSREGIYVEHGNQYGEALSRVDDMTDPRDPHDPDRLALPVGSRLLGAVFNGIERERYWVDGVKPIEALLWYALVYDFVFAARVLAWFIRALPGVIVGGLLERSDPRADLLLQLEDPVRAREIGTRYQEDEVFRDWLDARVNHVVPVPTDFSFSGAGARTLSGDAVSRGDEIRRQVRSSLFEAAQRCAAAEGAKVVIFGHTHVAGEEDLGSGATYFNSGTWTWSGDFGGASKQTWRDLFQHPDRYTANRSLSHVRIDYDGLGQPVGRLVIKEISSERGWLRAAPAWWRRFRDWLSLLWQRFVAILGHRGAV